VVFIETEKKERDFRLTKFCIFLDGEKFEKKNVEPDNKQGIFESFIIAYFLYS